MGGGSKGNLQEMLLPIPSGILGETPELTGQGREELPFPQDPLWECAALTGISNTLPSVREERLPVQLAN